MTWSALVSDPLTTIAGVVAAAAVLQALPTDKPSTWVIAIAAGLGGIMARDKQRRSEEAKASSAEGTRNGDS